MKAPNLNMAKYQNQIPTMLEKIEVYRVINHNENKRTRVDIHFDKILPGNLGKFFKQIVYQHSQYKSELFSLPYAVVSPNHSFEYEKHDFISDLKEDIIERFNIFKNVGARSFSSLDIFIESNGGSFLIEFDQYKDEETEEASMEREQELVQDILYEWFEDFLILLEDIYEERKVLNTYEFRMINKKREEVDFKFKAIFSFYTCQLSIGSSKEFGNRIIDEIQGEINELAERINGFYKDSETKYTLSNYNAKPVSKFQEIFLNYFIKHINDLELVFKFFGKDFFIGERKNKTERWYSPRPILVTGSISKENLLEINELCINKSMETEFSEFVKALEVLD